MYSLFLHCHAQDPLPFDLFTSLVTCSSICELLHGSMYPLSQRLSLTKLLLSAWHKAAFFPINSGAQWLEALRCIALKSDGSSATTAVFPLPASCNFRPGAVWGALSPCSLLLTSSPSWWKGPCSLVSQSLWCP